jgi:hypothetical protein
MASIHTTRVVFVVALLLAPGMILSIPPGPNKKWLFGGQVTFLNALIHAGVIAGIVFLFGQ